MPSTINILRNKVEVFSSNLLSELEYIKNLIQIFTDYVKTGHVEKKKFGEVMTPIDLVNDMLNVLPKDIWTNPNLKILDPASGIGIFTGVILERFMEGLSQFEPNESKRYKHIIENMIYACEIQQNNADAYLYLFNIDSQYKPNMYYGDFLHIDFDKHMTEVWGIDKFDIIVGNPPFNQSIDLKFLKKSYSLSKTTLFVQPSTWLIDEKNIQKKFTEAKQIISKNLEHVVLFNGNKTFGIQLFVPCSITHVNKEYTGKIKVNDKISAIKIEYKSIDDVNKYSSPEYITIKQKIKTHSEIDNVWTHKNDSGKFYINMSAIRGHVSMSEDRSLVKNDFYTTVTKIERVSKQRSKYLCFGFNNTKEANNFLIYNKTRFFRFCLSIFKNNGNLHRGELAIIPWLDFSAQWTDEKLYKHFQLTDQEISFIEQAIPDYY